MAALHFDPHLSPNTLLQHPQRTLIVGLALAGTLALPSASRAQDPSPPADSTNASQAGTPADSIGVAKPAAAVGAVLAPKPAATAPGSQAGQIGVGGVIDLGFENVSADSLDGRSRVAFENRRYRHTADCVGLIEQEAGGHVVMFERRLDMVAAALETEGPLEAARYRLHFPSDRDFPTPPGGRPVYPTNHTVDFLLRPLFSYELGRLTVPVQLRFQLESMMRYNPWSGALATASLVIPVYNDFDPSELHPDVDDVRPGQLTLDQYAWLPGIALASATAGLLGDNRYGASAGLARPMMNGALVADAQADVTGFVAFESAGISYSAMSQWSAFGGLTWFLPKYDVSLRARAGRFLYGDDGVHLEFRRSFGDFEYAIFVLHAGDLDVQGVRVTLPIPPLTRPTQQPVRAMMIERFPLSYRSDATPVGTFVGGVASREDYLRQLSAPALEANDARVARAYGDETPLTEPKEVEWINSSGMSGFIFTPWAGVLSDRTVSLDYTHVPKEWSYSGRDEFVNQAYSLDLGILPRCEFNLRFTRLPGAEGFLPGDPDNLISTDTDHMVSGRLALLIPHDGKPGLSIGVDDMFGTKRFNSSYAVAGLPFAIKSVQSRFSLGYAPPIFTAARHVLDGGFGALEVSPWRAVAARIEYDTEKWNVGIGVALPFGLRLRASALNLETLSAGAGWTHEL